MRLLGEFRLKTLLDRIAGELRQSRNESQHTRETEYSLKKPVCEQRENTERKDEMQ